jgi:phosphoglycerate kinase
MKEFNNFNNLIKKDLLGKTILVRVDLNVPMKNGKITDLTRILGVLPTICQLSAKNAKVVLLSHFGRPNGFDMSNSLAPIVDELQKQIELHCKKNTKVHFGIDCIGLSAKHAIEEAKNGEVILLENLRFHKEEEENNLEFAKKLAENADYYVNDAFSCSHRSHASITGITNFLPSFAGLLLEHEVTSLEKSFEKPKKPFVAIVGGSKISTKIDILTALSKRADYIFIGGAMANTFFHALGKNVGSSLCEKDMVTKAKQIIKDAEKNNCEIILPSDVVVSKSIDDKFNTKNISLTEIKNDEMILDAGFETLVDWHKIIKNCKTLIWNGPIGAFEFEPFNNSSVALARLVSKLTLEEGLYSVAGGGDTVSLLSVAGVRNGFSYLSTAGGAFLEWLEGKNLPGIEALTTNNASIKKAV